MIRIIVLAGLIGFASFGAMAQPQIQAIVNSASYQPGLPLGGGLATIFISGLNSPPGTYIAAPSSPLPFQLGEVKVFVNGGFAPLLAVVIPSAGDPSFAQINFQVPLERNAYSGIMAVGTRQGPAMIQPLPSLPAWGGFFSDPNGYAVARHASDNSLVTSDNPAHPGETIVAYGNDCFPVWPPPPMGFPVPEQPLFTFVPDIGSTNRSLDKLYLQDYPLPDPRGNTYAKTPPLKITFSGLAAGQIGVEEIRFVVRSDIGPGDWALFFNRQTPSTASSSPYVKLPVR